MKVSVTVLQIHLYNVAAYINALLGILSNAFSP